MKIINTREMNSEPQGRDEKLYVYNGLDCMVTFEVFEAIAPQLDPVSQATYDFERALMAPVLEMNARGILVDQTQRASVLAGYRATASRLHAQFDKLCLGVFGFTINPFSPDQVGNLFYDVMRIPPIKKQGRRTTDRDALEKLHVYFLALPFLRHILSLRDLSKKISVLSTAIDNDGRIRTSTNIAGTKTGRFSSSLSDFGTGGNLQNIEERLRSIFIADPGHRLAYLDLEQAESRLVGALVWNLFGDGSYLDACESGDLHTTVCKLAWPSLPWTGDPRRDRELAERPFYRQHSYRHMAKVLGHGTNYRGSPNTMSQHTKIEAGVIREFQRLYFGAFPGIPEWHKWVAKELETQGVLTNLMGRRRWFFGRRNEDDIVREAIAYDPQGSVGNILNTGMLRVWRGNFCKLLLQVHDAILIEYPEGDEHEVVTRALECLRVPVPLAQGRTLVIPADAAVGWNWAKAESSNPNGLVKFKKDAPDGRKPQRAAPVSILDRIVARV